MILRPSPFIPELLNNKVSEPVEDEPYVRDKTTGFVWHRCRTRVLYIDTDRSQIVYHSNYLRYFELGRASLMRDAAYTYREIEEDGYVYPIIEIGVKYYMPLHYDESIWIHTRPSEIERVRLRFDYVITPEATNEIICKGFTRHCAVNSKGTPVAVDDKTVYLWNIFPK